MTALLFNIWTRMSTKKPARLICLGFIGNTVVLEQQVIPYIEQKSRNLFMSLGQGVSLLALDCRTERRVWIPS
jgi:hypothetical protein